MPRDQVAEARDEGVVARENEGDAPVHYRQVEPGQLRRPRRRIRRSPSMSSSGSEASRSRSRVRERPVRVRPARRRRSPSPRERRRRRSPRPRGRRSPSQRRPRAATPRRRRRRLDSSSSSSSSSSEDELESVRRSNAALLKRLERVEKFEERTKKKEKDKFKWTKTGCEKQHDFNVEVREVFCDKLREELKNNFEERIPDKIEVIIKEGEKMIEDQCQKLKIADELGFRALDDYGKEELARNDKEEKKIKMLRKEKKEREERSKKSKGGYSSFRDRKFGDRGKKFEGNRDNRDNRAGGKSDIKCFTCDRFGHMARECNKPKEAGGRGRK